MDDDMDEFEQLRAQYNGRVNHKTFTNGSEAFANFLRKFSENPGSETIPASPHLLVEGPPRSGKTRFLARSALSLAFEGKKTLCLIPEGGFQAFLEELQAEWAGMSEEKRRLIIPWLTIDDVTAAYGRGKADIMRKAEIIVINDNFTKYRKFFSEGGNTFQNDVVICDFLNTLSYKHMFTDNVRGKKLIVSFDTHQPFYSIDLRRIAERLEGDQLDLKESRIAKPLFCWLKMIHYKGVTGQTKKLHNPVVYEDLPPTVPIVSKNTIPKPFVPNYPHAEYNEAIKVIALMTKLLEDNISPDDIGVGTAFRGQRRLISDLLQQDTTRHPLADNIRIGHTKEIMNWRPVKYFIYSLSCTLQTMYSVWGDLDESLVVAASRASKRFYFFGDSSVLKKKSNLCVFLRWLNNDRMTRDSAKKGKKGSQQEQNTQEREQDEIESTGSSGETEGAASAGGQQEQSTRKRKYDKIESTEQERIKRQNTGSSGETEGAASAGGQQEQSTRKRKYDKIESTQQESIKRQNTGSSEEKKSAAQCWREILMQQRQSH